MVFVRRPHACSCQRPLAVAPTDGVNLPSSSSSSLSPLRAHYLSVEITRWRRSRRAAPQPDLVTHNLHRRRYLKRQSHHRCTNRKEESTAAAALYYSPYYCRQCPSAPATPSATASLSPASSDVTLVARDIYCDVCRRGDSELSVPHCCRSYSAADLPRYSSLLANSSAALYTTHRLPVPSRVLASSSSSPLDCHHHPC